jgi:hypothetical protein
MNKRIQEMAEHCTIQYRDGHGEYVDQVDVEKFAELIVRECAWAAQNKDDTCMDLRYGRAVAAGKILKHFGVE